LAEHYPQYGARLHEASRARVIQPGLRPEEYRAALHQAEAVRCLVRCDGAYLSTLGMAHYRVGNYQVAVEKLLEAQQRTQAQFADCLWENKHPYVVKAPYPADLAFLSMAHYQLGHEEQARKALERLQEVMNKPPWASDGEAQALFMEASATLSRTRESSKE